MDSRFDAVGENPSQHESDGGQDHDGGAHDFCTTVKLSKHKNNPQDSHRAEEVNRGHTYTHTFTMPST